MLLCGGIGPLFRYVNGKLEMYQGAASTTLDNATGLIESYKITQYIACCTLEITPKTVKNDTLLAWGLISPDRKLYITLPTIGGNNIPCVLTTNGELRVYYPISTALERIDYTFMYPSKR